MTVQLDVDGSAVATLLLNNPARHNALTPEDRFEAARMVSQLRFDTAVRAVLVRGSGKSFCAGADVGRMGEDDLFASRARMQRGAHALIRALTELEKPVIAAVRGYALGMGWSIALAADLVLASDTARFSTIFVKRGLAPDSGAIHLLARHIGVLRAKDLVFRPRMINAEQARELGLVTEVVPDGQLDAAAASLAADMATGPTRALGFAKQLFSAAADSSLDRFLEIEALVQPQLNQSGDFREGVAAFRENRTPDFTGN